ncbi:hypothetical protein CHU92_09150 [Flavobacterium cyanobacteriorum]|uniref:Uncharacterized protein n=1 Tax=Flavobacterium cyanobacteriorum TaxID=2022802 RepID=A0A255Z5V0_9FLAO|nr:hypothetical protein [Flavobacterium cyanobacteriorum]OYQ36907.1 hypothetical protein CHU92_09150 [Flavobacterium cyanobacteriorum]
MMIRKYIATIISVLILVSNIGLALNVHYCMGSVSSVSLAYKVDEPENGHHGHKHDKAGKMACCKTSDKGHKSCCENDFVKLQDKNEGKVIVKSLQFDLDAFCRMAEWKPVPFYQQPPAIQQQVTSFYCEANAPPLFKLYCRYIFYA